MSKYEIIRRGTREYIYKDTIAEYTEDTSFREKAIEWIVKRNIPQTHPCLKIGDHIEWIAGMNDNAIILSEIIGFTEDGKKAHVLSDAYWYPNVPIAKIGDTIEYSFDNSESYGRLAGKTFHMQVAHIDWDEQTYKGYPEYGQDEIPFKDAKIVERS